MASSRDPCVKREERVHLVSPSFSECIVRRSQMYHWREKKNDIRVLRYIVEWL